jgi:hypothetical protein
MGLILLQQLNTINNIEKLIKGKYGVISIVAIFIFFVISTTPHSVKWDMVPVPPSHLTVSAHDTFWGGYSGYFQDPDGHLWEVVWNPAWEFPN